MIYFSDFSAGGTFTPDDPNYYRTAFLVDATGQSNGTGYATDESRHAWALTYNGNAQITSGKFEFDGTGDYISAPHTILWTPGSKFTMEVFGLVFDAVNTGTPQIIAGQSSIDTIRRSWEIFEDSGSLKFNYSTDGNTNTTITIGSVAIATTYNAVVCWDGSSIYTLLNGAQGGSASFSGSFFDNDQNLRLGCMFQLGSAARFLDGRFTAFVYTKGECLYSSSGPHSVPSLPRAVDTPSLTDSEWPNVIMLLGYDDTLSRIRDFGPLDLPIIVAGNAAGSTSVALGDGTDSIAFDGTGDYLQFADDPLFELGSSAYTFEAFVRHSVNTTLQTYISHWNATASQRSYIWQYRGADATDIVRLDYSTNLTTGLAGPATAAFTPTVGQFYHLAVCRSGNDHKQFVGGTQSGSTATLSITYANSSDPLRIGADGTGASGMNGYLTQVRITKAARYTSNFTAPTGALPIG